MDITQNNKILVLGAHPDDETLGVGGTILKAHSNNSIVDVLIATDGASSQYAGDSTKQSLRSNYFSSACEILKINNIFQLDFPDMKLDTIPHIDLNMQISDVIQKGNYDTIFIHHPHDINKDHQILFHSVMVACRPILSKTPSIYTYYTVSSSEWGIYESNTIFCPNVFVDISEFIDQKIAAFECYKDEIRDYPHPRSIENIINTAKFFGSQIGVHFAEPFRLVRLLN